MGSGAFRECRSLRRVVFREGSALHTIGADCFRGSGLQRIELPGSLRAVNDGAFADCKGLQFVGLNDGLARLGEEEKNRPPDPELPGFGEEPDQHCSVFQSSVIAEMRVPSTPVEIQSGTFQDCKLTAIQIGEDCPLSTMEHLIPCA